MKIAAYCRVSSDKEDQLNSLENQKQFFQEYATINKHELYRVYADEGITGTSLKKREDFKRLLEDAKYGLFELVVVKDVSRFARNTVDFLQSIRLLKAMGINTVFLTANMTSLGDSEFILTIFGAMAQEESANLSKRVKWGKKITAQRGHVPNHIYGYDRVDNYTLKINEEEAAVIREIFRMHIEGLGRRQIALELNKMGIKTKTGTDWIPTTIKRMLTNSTYCGRYVNRKYEIRDYLEGKLVKLPEDEHIVHLRPEWAIISTEDFEKAQKLLEDRRGHYNTARGDEKYVTKGRYSSRHIFSTLIKCEHCGRSYCRKTHKYVNTYYYWFCALNQCYPTRDKKCHNNVAIREDKLLDIIKEYFKSAITDKDAFVKQIVDDYQRLIKEDVVERHSAEDIEKKIQQLEFKQTRLYDLYTNEIITMDELKKKIAPLKDEVAELSALLKQEEIAEKKVLDAKSLAEKYVKEINKFLEMETVTNADMRKIVEKITINSDHKVTIFIKKIEDMEFL